MTRALAVLLAAALACSCSRTPTEAEPSPEAAAAAQALGLAPAAPPEPPKPVPAQLPEVIARVNGEDVTKAELERAIQSFETSRGTTVPPDQRDAVYRGMLDQLIAFKLLLQEGAARKLTVDDAEVEARLASIKKQFGTEDRFVQTLIDKRLTIEQIRLDARRDLIVAKVLESEIAKKVAPTADQVQDFYAKNPERFKQSESVHARHILLAYPPGADAAAKAEVRTKAEQVLKEVKSGGDFGALAKKYSQDPGSAPNGGDLGFFQQGQMVGPFNDVAFTLKPGAVSDLVETQFGLHIIRVEEKKAARDVPLEEVKPQVEQYLTTVNQQQQTAAFVSSLKAKSKIEVLM